MLESKNPTCSPRSLPSCLFFLSRADALDKARSLAAFLQDAAASMAASDNLGEHNVSGMVQCFELLKDELDIAAGEYLFPLVGRGEDAALCARLEDGSHD